MLSKEVNNGGSPPSKIEYGLAIKSVWSSNTLLRKLFEDIATLFQRQEHGKPCSDGRLVL